MAGKYAIPLVNGGTGPFHGEVTVYQPGQTACLDCCMGINHLAVVAEGQVTHCGDTPEPSIVISNLLIGGLMAAEAFNLLRVDRYKPTLSGTLAYDACQPSRLGVRAHRPPCHCHERGQS